MEMRERKEPPKKSGTQAMFTSAPFRQMVEAANVALR